MKLMKPFVCVVFTAAAFAMACGSQEREESVSGPVTVLEEQDIYYHQLPPDHEAIQFARAHNPNFDEILAGGND